MIDPYCPVCWSEKQYCQCPPNTDKPVWEEWEPPTSTKDPLPKKE